MANRYKQLIDLVEQLQPKRIVEIGTWKGERAVQMLEASPLAHYYGFDLFELATAQTDEVEFNVKPHHSVAQVRAYLDQHFPRQYNLYAGNSRETLKNFQTDFVDFVFIDGGHSKETIRSDIRNSLRLLEGNGTMVLDDYYRGVGRMGVGVDGDMLLDLHQRGGIVELLPQKDGVAGGGTVQLVKVVYDGTT